MKIHTPSRYIIALLVIASGIISQNAYARITPNNRGTKETVEAMFADTPEMIAIAKCESSFQQYTSTGATFLGAGGAYVGVFQIGKGHAAAAKKLGFDIYTLEGNLAYAQYMYKQSGTAPWTGCVKPGSATTPPPPETPTTETPKPTHATVKQSVVKKPATKKTEKKTTHVLLTTNMGVGATNSEVKNLQRILNASGYFVAHDGKGSPNHETSLFGLSTQEALERFQCAHNIACSGDQNSTGYGYLGPVTRRALLNEAKKQGL